MRLVPMIFPGQASQVVGMARDLAGGSGPAADFLCRVDRILEHRLTRVMFEGPADILTQTHHAQPAILAHSVAVVLALLDRGVAPSIVAGHSLGEYSAAVAAGALAPDDGLMAVRRRGELMFAAGREQPGAMAAVLGLSAARVAEVCAEVAREHGVVVVANHNSAVQVAISGEVKAVEAASAALVAAGARRVVPLNVSGAFHSPLLEGTARSFATFLAALEVADPVMPLVANVSAEPVSTAAELRAGFERQLTAPVRWQETMERICRPETGEAPRLVLEVGPGKVLSNLARREYPEVAFAAVGTVDDLERIDALLDEHGI
ncbi:MAG: ACP S-malonyltransferase [Candidatus Krumholzibacteriia bacterium]